jgi:transposase, IS5 family
MDAVIPWARLIALIAPHYPKARRGQRFLGLEKMPRICFLQLLVRPLGRGGGKRRV